MLPSQKMYNNSFYTNQSQRYYTNPNKFHTITSPPFRNPLTTSNTMTNPLISNTMINPLTSNTIINPLPSFTIINPINTISSNPSPPITFQLSCKICLQKFGQPNSIHQPRILPCGHSYCQQCLSNVQREILSNSLLLSGTHIGQGQMGLSGHVNVPIGTGLVPSETFTCYQCSTHIDVKSIQLAPVNRLYYDMLKSIKEYLEEKQFQGQYKKQNDQNEKMNENDQNDENIDQIKLRYENKCLYVFCHNLKFQKDNERFVYCSSKCRQLGEALMAGVEENFEE